MTRTLHTLLVLLSLGLPGLSAHANGDWYHVELMVFAHERASDEQWRRNRLPAYPEPYIHFSERGTRLPVGAGGAFRAALNQGAWQPVSNLSMDEMRERMARSGHYRTLFHYSWRQPIGPREQALPIYIQGGEMLNSGAPDDVSLAELAPASAGEDAGPAPDDDEAASARPPLPELQGTLMLSESRFLHLEPNLWLALSDGNGEHYFASLTQSRRLRAGELHYIDNPRLGVLIKISR